MASGDPYFECDTNKGLEQVIREMIYDDGDGNPVWSLNVAGSALDPYFNCDERKQLSTEQVIRAMIVQDGTGKPRWNTSNL